MLHMLQLEFIPLQPLLHQFHDLLPDFPIRHPRIPPPPPDPRNLQSMPTETERRIDCVMIALTALRREGVIPADAPISPEGMAWVSNEIGEPVSKSTFARLNRRGVLALRAHLASSRNHQS